MAAPAPATGLIAGLAATAAAAALDFDIALANNTQLTEGRPLPPPAPATQANRPHNAPPPAPIAGIGPMPLAFYPACTDRVHHRITAATGACLSPQNLGPVAVLRFPVQLGADVRTCAIVDPLHPGGFLVCVHCLQDTHRQRWSRAIYRDVTVLPANLPPAAPTPQPLTFATAPPGIAVWKKFMTHLCLSCEREEMLLLASRTVALPRAPATVLPTRRGYNVNEEWPYVTCTCLSAWHDHADFAAPGWEVCIRHRQRMACEQHDERLIIRNQNDKWLRESAKDPNNPRRIIRLRHNNIAHWNIMNARAASGTYRACRCGAEPRQGVPQVWMCLGCEGVIHNAPVPAAGIFAPFMLPPGFPTVRTRRTQRTLRSISNFPLRRARA